MSTLSDEFGLGSSGGMVQQKRSSLADEFGLSAKSKQNTSLVSDLGTDLKRGAQKLPGVATGLADVAVAGLTGRRFVDETADKLGEMTGFQPSKWSEEARDEYSPERQAGAAEIDKAWDEGTATDVAGAYLSNPGNVAGLVAESLPQMLAGGVVGRGALAAGRATGLVGAPATAAQAATQGAIAGGVGEGAVMAGGAMDQISDDVDPRRAAAAAAATGVVGGALGAAGAKIAQRLGVLDAESAIAGGIREASGEVPGLARRMAGGALAEGVFEELPQSVQETALQNWAEEKDLTEGMARSAVEGALAGSAMGAGVNVIPPRKRSEEMGLDPNAGALSAAAVVAVDSAPAQLPAPERLALPAPDQTFYADSEGNVSGHGPARDVDREQRPVPGREQAVRDFGPGMDQQVDRGVIPATGELIPATPEPVAQQEFEPRTFDAEPVRQAIPDLREDVINVDVEGNAAPGKVATPRPADYVQGGRGMDQQAPVGKTFSNAFAAKNAIQRSGGVGTLEAVQVGPKQFEVRAISAPATESPAAAANAAPMQQPAINAADAPPQAADKPVHGAEPAAIKRTPPKAPVKPAQAQPVDRHSLPEVLRLPKKLFIAKMAKATGIKKGSPGYESAVQRLEGQYESQIDDAQASLPFEQFNALNRESPEGVNRQAWEQLRKERGLDTAEAVVEQGKATSIAGKPIDREWTAFSDGSGSLSIPRADMPQIKAEHRGAMVNFLNARGVSHREESVSPNELKPTQAEFSTKKVGAAKEFKGGDRSILVSSDGHVLDGHHQWLAKRESGEDVKVIRLDKPIRQLLDVVGEFPSATVDAASEPQRSASTPIEDAGEKLGGARKDQFRSVRERLDAMDDEAIANSTLSQLWPKGELDRIENPLHAAFYHVVRSHIPNKPRVPYRLKAWVSKVKAAREMIDFLSDMGADVTLPKMRERSLVLRREADHIELLMGLDRKHWDRIEGVSINTGHYNSDGEMIPGSWVSMKIDGRHASFYGHAAVASALPEIKEAVEGKDAPQKKMKFAIYSDRGTGAAFITQDSDKERRALKKFPDVKAARAYLSDNYDDLVAAWETVKNRDNVTRADMRRKVNDARVGQDYRKGKNVTPDDFLEAFGFRGVEFGNWVGQGAGAKERQGMLNEAYDAFMDLASILDVPPKALSLEGKLGIGFGSRGSGRFSAHYEPDNIVINLTKTKGAGSLAHEWFHALDNYFARKRAGVAIKDLKTAFITYRPEPLLVNQKYPSRKMTRTELARYQSAHPGAQLYAEASWAVDQNHPEGVRPQVEKSFAELVETLNASPMLQRSKVIDGKASDGYWSRIIERGARSFETYVIARLSDKGARNDFLANVQTLEQFARDPGRYPYLTPDEQGPVNEAFDKLFATIQTATDETGRVAFYSRQSYRQGQGGQSNAGQLRLQLKTLTSNWRNTPKIKVVQSVKDLPDAQRSQVERDGAFDVEGMFADGQVYLVADNLRDAKHAAFVLQHEVLGHAGLQGAYGHRLTPLLMSIYNGNASLKQQADSLVKQFGYSPSVAMEEVLADMAADGTLQQQSFWGRLVAAMRNVLRSILGNGLSWREGDIKALLGNARSYIENGKRRPGARAAFSRDGRSSRGTEIADEKGRLLAPNGKPSKLNQRQWHQVRSANFKKWFGDWQVVATQNRLDAMKPLRLRMPEAWRGMSEREKLAAVEAALKNMARSQEVLHHDELGDVQVGMRGAKKAVSNAADPAKKLVLHRLRETFEHSIYAGQQEDQAGRNGLIYHKLIAPIEIDDLPLAALFTVREDANGAFFYNAVTVSRKEEAPAASPREVILSDQRSTSAITGASTSAVSPGDVSNEAQRSLPANTEVSSFVRQSLKRVNPDDVSKVIDGNGEPLVLYHGTGEQFTVFDQGRAGQSTGHSTAPLGIFMTEDAELADAYAEKAADGMPGLANVLPLYASIKKPYQMPLTESQSLNTPQKSIAFRQKLESEGFDGIQIQGSPVWIAFYNDQVKSATSNTGAFDAVNPDIRYRRAGQERPDLSDIFSRFAKREPDPSDLFAEENRRLREQDKTLWDKAKREFRRQFAPGGLLPDAVFGEKVKRDSEFQAVEFDVRHLARGLEGAIKTDFGMAIDELPADQMARLADALAGKVDPTLPEATKLAIVAMRQYIDSLSAEYVSILKQQVRENLQGADPALIEKITENMGSYVHRSYQAFDDPKWFQKVPIETVNAARNYLAKGYMEQGDSKKDAYERAEVKINEMLKTGTAYDSMESFIAEGKLGAKDLSVLIKRKSIAPEIRALLGEYTDPRLNFAKSATKMGRLIWNQRFLDRVREAGMGTFLFDGKDRPAGATVQIAGENSDAYAPLNGLWTFPDVAQAFKDSLGKEQMSDLYRTIVRYNGMVKYGKTVLSPTTAMRNWQSAMFFSLANGHFDLTQMKHSWAALREQVTQNATSGDLAYLRKLKQLGVVYDTPYAGEMMALLNDARMDELLSGKSGTGIKWLRKINEVAQGFYSFGDDFWKIIGFENEKAGLVKAGIPAAQAEQMAAERIRNTYPTYSMVGKGINWLRRFPLMGSFVSFPAEIIRTSVNMLQLTAADLKSDNPGLQAIGRKRVMGLAMVSAGFYAVAAMTAAAFGVGDDEEEAIRDLAAPWQRNSTFLYTGRDADGKLRYFDMSFLDPYGYWKRPLTAMMRDQPWEKAAASGIGDMLSPFLGTDIAAGAIFEVLSNKKGGGGQVYLENASTVDQTTAIADHLRKALQPGFVSNAERLLLAGQGARREGSGQPYDMRDEVVSLLGWRASTLDTQTALYYRSFEFTDSLRDASKVLNRTLRSSNDVSDGDIRSSREAALKQYDQAFKEMGRLVNSARAAGMSNQQITQTLRSSGVTGQNAMALTAGRVPKMNIASLQGQARATQQARMMQGSEHAQEIARRFAVARQQQ
jgi:hypothetical protein